MEETLWQVSRVIVVTHHPAFRGLNFPDPGGPPHLDRMLWRAFSGNTAMVALEKLEDPQEIAEVRAMIERHVRYTGSDRGRYILQLWEDMAPKFVKVMPKDYKRILTALKKANESGLSGEDAITAAFEENARDVARIGGG